MTASAHRPLAGYIRGLLPVAALRELLVGNLSYKAALDLTGGGVSRRIHHSGIATETLVGFVPFPQVPREIIVGRLPLAQRVVPAVALHAVGESWRANPMLVTKDYLLRYEGVQLEADWIDVLVNLAARLTSPRVRRHGVDEVAWMIALRWEIWERQEMTWPQRCHDLARALNREEGDELTPNTLLRKCERLGLIHRDNKRS